MNKKITLCLFTIIVLILFISYSSERNQLSYYAPTQDQVNTFLTDNPINPLTIKEASDFSVILFENISGFGHYVLYQDQNRKLYHTLVTASGNPKDNPVSLCVTSGKHTIVTAIINDAEMLKKAKGIEIHFKDGGIVNEVISGKGIVILYDNEMNDNPMKYIKFIIHDNDRNILYEL